MVKERFAAKAKAEYLQILRSSFGPLVLVGLSVWRYSGSLSVRAKTGACVPPLGALFLLLSVFAAIMCARRVFTSPSNDLMEFKKCC